jgi:hypothetical protein
VEAPGGKNPGSASPVITLPPGEEIIFDKHNSIESLPDSEIQIAYK